VTGAPTKPGRGPDTSFTYVPRYPLLWLLSALGVLVLAGLTLWMSVAIMPPLADTIEIGTQVPWFLTWGLIALTIVMALLIGWNLIKTGLVRHDGRER